MTRIEALKALLAKVEGGTLTAFDCGSLAVWWPENTPFDGDKITLTTPLECMGGSLDVAKALHEAVLPDWDWDIFVRGGMSQAMLDFDRGDELKPIIKTAANEIPALAWFIAILHALISKEEAA